MAPPSRRAVLRSVGVALAAYGTGCVSDGDGNPTATDRTIDATPMPIHTSPATTTPNETERFPPDVDERIDRTPPGSPALDPTGSWPSFRYDAGNTGANLDGTGLRDGKVYWRLDAGRAASVADGSLYNVFGRDQQFDELTLRDAATAAVEHRTKLVQYGVNPPPVVDDGRVFLATFIEAFCFDAESGEQLWRGPEMDGIQGCPTVADGTVVVNSGGFDGVPPHVRAFDVTSGEQRWRYDVGAESKSTPATDGDLVFVASTNGLHAIDAANGDERWVLDESQHRWSTPVVRGEVVYSYLQGDETTELLAVDVGDGSIHQRFSVVADGPPVVSDEFVFARTEEGIASITRNDGTVQVSGATAARPLGLVGNVLYGAGDGTVFAFDAANELEPLWSIETEEVQISDTVGRHVYHVTPVDGAVYVSARDAFYGIGPK